jgi:hypothetical protein
LEPKTLQYSRKPNHKAHYTKEYWRTHENLQALRSMRMQLLADAIEETDNAERIIARAKKKGGRDKAIPPERYNEIWKMAKKEEWQELSEMCTQVVEVMESHLSKKARYERALQMRKNIKVRKERFGDPDKKMLKLVINSIMQRHQAQQHITRAESGGDMKYGKSAVAIAIT